MIKKVEEYKTIQKLYNSLFDDIELGKIGKIDYKWNGKKVIRDNITFTREELVNFFRYKIYGKSKKQKAEELI